MENRLEDGEDETHSIFQEYFHYVMENNNLHHPSSIQEAGILFEKLTKFACPS
jgi:hypothetical protein